MRHIDIDAVPIPAGWTARSADAKEKVRAGEDIDVYSAVWRDLKPNFASFSHNKCWYCESNVDRADNAIDHFRPKSRVANTNPAHSGYRWLAFEPTNFRYACTFCNSRRLDQETGQGGGKHDHFPLMNEGTRAYNEGDLIDHEDVELLDPYSPTDWRLLSCEPGNGRPCPTTDDVDDIRRVNTSIRLYHLDKNSTCRERHSTVVGLTDAIDIASTFFSIYRQSKTPENKVAFEGRLRAVVRYIKPQAPFSGEMKMVLSRYRSDKNPWVAQLLET